MRKLTLLFLFSSQMTFASFDMNKNMQRSYLYILNLEFDKADILLTAEELQNPTNGFLPLLRNYIDFLTVVIDEDYNYFTSHEHFKKERLELLDKNDRSSPYYLYSKAEISLQWAFSRLKFEQYTTAAYEFVKAYRFLKDNERKFPDFTLNNKGLGLIHILLGAVPEQFHWILDVAGLDGSVSLGFRELDTVLNDDNFAMYDVEVLFLLSFFQSNLGSDDAISQKYLDKIGDRYKDNILLNFTAARLSHKLGNNDYCLIVLNNRPVTNSVVKFHHLDYLHGMSYLYTLDYTNAKDKFEYFIGNFRGFNYIKSAMHKLAWIAFLQNNTEKRLIYFDQVISTGRALIDEDKVALKDAQRNYISDPLLLKTRLLYDGGYYSLALSQLNKIDGPKSLSTIANEVEYWYRLARVKSELEDSMQEIIVYYRKALDKGQYSSSYYAPMSALQIGLIYEEKKDLFQADLYFKRCLEMSGFDYERGIHQKAKSALQRLSD